MDLLLVEVVNLSGGCDESILFVRWLWWIRSVVLLIYSVDLIPLDMVHLFSRSSSNGCGGYIMLIYFLLMWWIYFLDLLPVDVMDLFLLI